MTASSRTKNNEGFTYDRSNRKEKVHPQLRGQEDRTREGGKPAPGAGWMGVGPSTPRQAALAELLGLPENVKPYSIVGIGYPAEDADLEAADRFDATRIHYNKY